MRDMSTLETATTGELLDELKKRYDAIVIATQISKISGTNDVDVDWRGPCMTCTVLARRAVRVLDRWFDREPVGGDDEDE